MRNAEKTSIWLSVYLHMLYLKSSLTALPLHLHLSSSLLVNAPSPQPSARNLEKCALKAAKLHHGKLKTLYTWLIPMRNAEYRKIEVRPSLNSFLQIISTFIYPFPPFIAFCWLQTTFNFPDSKSIWNVQYFKSIWNVQHFKYMCEMSNILNLFEMSNILNLCEISNVLIFFKCPKF